jgi:dTDP-4-amino-4,6-dideoxygalactose transaminase
MQPAGMRKKSYLISSVTTTPWFPDIPFSMTDLPIDAQFPRDEKLLMQGGALLINDAQFNQRAEILREKGTDRSRFFRDEIDKYNWVDVGSSYLPSDLLAAFLREHLEQRDQIQSMRRQVWQNYARELASWAETNGARLPIIP